MKKSVVKLRKVPKVCLMSSCLDIDEVEFVLLLSHGRPDVEVVAPVRHLGVGVEYPQDGGHMVAADIEAGRLILDPDVLGSADRLVGLEDDRVVGGVASAGVDVPNYLKQQEDEILKLLHS